VVAERLAEDAALEAGRADHVDRAGALVVLARAVAARDHLGIGGLVLGAREADGERVERRAAQRRGDGDHAGGIDAPRQEGAQRHVRDQARGGGVAQAVGELGHRLGFGAGMRRYGGAPVAARGADPLPLPQH
jgi:hypothetical protein